MKIKITALCIAAAICISVLMTGCGGNAANGGTNNGMNGNSSGSTTGKIALTVWGSADDQAMLRAMADDFIAQNSENNYEITVRVNGEDVAKDEALKDIDAAADVFAIANDQLGALVNADAVYENTKYAEEIYRTRTESSVSAAMVNGKLYGYPSSSETYFLFYDKSKLTEDDVKSLEGILAKKQESGVAPFAMDFGDAYFSSAFFLTAGCKLYGDDGQDPTNVTFNDENGMMAARYIASLKALGAEDITGDVAGSRFKAGKLASYVSGSWKTAAFSEALGENLGVAKLPTIRLGGKDVDMVSFAGGKMYVVNANTNHPVEAMELARFLTSEESQLRRFNERSLLPNNINLAEHEDILSDPAISAEVEQLQYSIATPSITQMSKYWTPVEAFTKDVFDGKITEKDMQAKLDQLVADITA